LPRKPAKRGVAKKGGGKRGEPVGRTGGGGRGRGCKLGEGEKEDGEGGQKGRSVREKQASCVTDGKRGGAEKLAKRALTRSIVPTREEGRT